MSLLPHFAQLLHESTTIFLFFNEALRSVYIVINKVITVAMAFCLSHLENWMQNLFNSSIIVSWSVTDFFNDSCNTSAIIYCETWTFWPFTRYLSVSSWAECMLLWYCRRVRAHWLLQHGACQEQSWARRRKPHGTTCGDQSMLGPACCFHVGGFRTSSFFFFPPLGKMGILFWELRVTVHLIVLCKKA